ncbi:MAG: hypothetical protein U0V18_12765 [Anaerolineales bacterium]
MSNTNSSEINLASTVEKVIDMNRWGFKLTYSKSSEYANGYLTHKVIYNSEWCRVSFSAYQRKNSPPDMYDLHVRYGRIHAPDESEKMTWHGEECYCWHSTGSTHIYFLEGLSPSETLKHPNLAIFEEAQSSKYDKIRLELGDFSPIHRESVIWEYFGLRLFELFDLRRPDIWDKYKDFLNHYYQKSSSSLWKVC